MHIRHSHLIFASEKVDHLINSCNQWLTTPDHVHLHHPVLEPVPVSSWQLSSCRHNLAIPVSGHTHASLTSLPLASGHWGLPPDPDLASLPHPVSLLERHLITPEPVLVKSCEAVDHNGQWQSQKEDTGQGTQSGKQFAKCGLKLVLDYVQVFRVRCLLMGCSPDPQS